MMQNYPQQKELNFLRKIEFVALILPFKNKKWEKESKTNIDEICVRYT